MVIEHTTTADKVYEEAVITNVLRNTDSKIVEISTYVKGKLQTFKVDKVNKSVEKGQVAILQFSKNNNELIKEIVPTNDAEYTDRVVINLALASVNVGTGEVTFTNGDKYKLADASTVINVTYKNDIETKSLTDLRKKQRLQLFWMRELEHLLSTSFMILQV